MKIPQIKMSDLVCSFEHIDPHDIELDDLKPGYIIKTLRNWKGEYVDDNFYLFLPENQLKKIFGDYKYDIPGFVQPDKNTHYSVSYITINGYEGVWPNAVNETFDVNDVWKSNIDVSYIISGKDVVDFFKEYDIYSL